MEITNCQAQSEMTLDEFYSTLAIYSQGGEHEKSRIREQGMVMLRLINALRKDSSPNRVFGLTSHLRLCLLAEDSYRSPWFVSIDVLDKHNITVDYLMPTSEAPWPKARVSGEAQSEEEAIAMILVALEKSRGWSNEAHPRKIEDP